MVWHAEQYYENILVDVVPVATIFFAPYFKMLTFGWDSVFRWNWYAKWTSNFWCNVHTGGDIRWTENYGAVVESVVHFRDNLIFWIKCSIHFCSLWKTRLRKFFLMVSVLKVFLVGVKLFPIDYQSLILLTLNNFIMCWCFSLSARSIAVKPL